MKKQLAALLLGMSALSAHAEDKPPAYDRVAFSVTVQKEVENDVLTAVLYAEQQGRDTVAMADQVNKGIVWGMDIAKKEPAIESRTLGYTTNPVYKDNVLDGWQVRQSIQLKSKDSKALGGMLGQLQEKLRIDSIGYSVSPDVQKTTKEGLVNAALDSFKKRAEQIKAAMGRAQYKVVKLDIQDTNDFAPMLKSYDGAMMRAAAAPAPAAPVLEGGTQELRVSVQAEIELSIN